MPNKCCVLGCKSGYESTKGKIHLFSFPKDKVLKIKWLKQIGRMDYNPGKWAVVCHKHFQESDIIRQCTGIDQNTGETFAFPVKVKLKDGAVPSFDLNNPYGHKSENEFENQEQLSTPRTSPRKSRLITKRLPKSETENSSDDDIPLEKVRNQYLSSDSIKSIHATEKNSSEDTNNDFPDDTDTSFKKKFEKLLEDYEQLKDRSVCLDHEIKVLEGVNTELICNIFK